MRIAPIATSVPKAMEGMKVALWDNFGVTTKGGKPLPGVVETYHAMRSQGIEVFMVSNTANLGIAPLHREFKEHGMPFPKGHIITSGMVLEPYFAEHDLIGKKVLCLGNRATAHYVQKAQGILLNHGNADKSILELAEQAEVVFIGWFPILGRNQKNRLATVALPPIQAAIKALKRPGVIGIVGNPDREVPQKDGTVLPGNGALAQAIQDAVGKNNELIWLGKPHLPIYKYVLGLPTVRDIPRDQIMMIGDSLEYDIEGAHNAGIHSLLVLTGNARLIDLLNEDLPDNQVPDFVAQGLVWARS